ncbi:hypothetical protein [Geotalea daltonii]|nr:hypothetical protein [Geotalea daltonii]
MLKDMKTQTHLKPGQKGTKRLVEKYGESLLCIGISTMKSEGFV